MVGWEEWHFSKGLFEIKYGISVPRVLWVQCEGGSLQNGVVLGFDYTWLNSPLCKIDL